MFASPGPVCADFNRELHHGKYSTDLLKVAEVRPVVAVVSLLRTQHFLKDFTDLKHFHGVLYCFSTVIMFNWNFPPKPKGRVNFDGTVSTDRRSCQIIIMSCSNPYQAQIHVIPWGIFFFSRCLERYKLPVVMNLLAHVS